MQKTRITKDMIYKSMMESGILLPKMTSTICNMSYLIRVKKNLEYCPHQSEIESEPKVCNNPPKKMVLLQIISEELSKKGDNRTISYDEKHLPDVDWCLISIFLLNPLHEIFEPSYIPEKGQKGRRGIRYNLEKEDIANLFDNMTLSSQKNRKASNANTLNINSIYDNSYEESNKNVPSQKTANNTYRNKYPYFEEQKHVSQEKVMIRKVFTDQKDKFGSMNNQIDIHKVGCFMEMMQEAIHPYLISERESNSNQKIQNAKKKENYIDRENSRNLKRTFEINRTFSDRTSASSETLNKQIKSPQQKPQEDLQEIQSSLKQKKKNIDQVMKDEICEIRNGNGDEFSFDTNNKEFEEQQEQQRNQEANSQQLFNI